MSDNNQLLDNQEQQTRAKRPRCSAVVAESWRRKEGDPRTVERTTQRTDTGRRAAIALLVDQLFGVTTTEHPAALNCELYLQAALRTWLSASCRSADSWYSYACRLWRWTADTDRRSLSAQVETNPRHLADWLYRLEEQPLSPRSIVAYRETVGSWFRWLTDREHMRRSPVTRDVRRLHRIDRGAVQKANGRRQVLSLAEAQRAAGWALTLASPEAGLGVLLQMTAGLRSQEVAQLERRHLVERDGVVTVTVPGKGARTRSVVLEAVAVAAWRRYVLERRRQGERGPLLVAPGGGHFDRRQVQRWAKALATVVGRTTEISSHDLRKTAATQLLLRGADIEQVQYLLGHVSADTTLTCYITDRRPLSVTTGITADRSAT